MHYKILPVADTYINTQYPTRNYGADEILELEKLSTTTSYILMDLDFASIKSKIANGDIPSGSLYTLYLYDVATARTDYQSLDYTINIKPITGSWSPGLGLDVDYLDTFYETNSEWVTYNEFTSSITVIDTPAISYTETGSYNENLELDITSLIAAGVDAEDTTPYSGVFITFSSASLTDQNYYKKYFYSADSETIYVPRIVAYFDDSVSTSEVATTGSVTELYDVRVSNKSNSISIHDTYPAHLQIRERYPSQIMFNTEYNELPSLVFNNLYFYIEDSETGDIIIPFTPVNNDSDGNWFAVPGNMFFIGRYYTVHLKHALTSAYSKYYRNVWTFKVTE